MTPRQARGRRSQDASPMVAELGRRFASFRRQHPRGTRVPLELRAAVLSALAGDAAVGDVARACGLSWGQIKAWEAGSRRSPRRTSDEDVRVFSVVDPAPVAPEAPVAVLVEDRLELRLGRWSVSVRLAERE